MIMIIEMLWAQIIREINSIEVNLAQIVGAYTLNMEFRDENSIFFNQKYEYLIFNCDMSKKRKKEKTLTKY